MAELKIKADSGGGTVSLKGPASTTLDAAVQLTLPVDDGTSGQYLKTDGSGALSWATVAGGVDGISSSADATAITIDSSERVGIGTTDPGTRRVKVEHTTDTPVQIHSTQSNCYVQLGNSSATNGYLGFETTNLTFHNNGKKAEIDTSGNLKVNAGNLVIGTSGKGIDFSANAHAAGMTSELLDDYEEGTYSPALTSSNGTYTMTVQSGRYVKIGHLCFCTWRVDWSSHNTTNQMYVSVPFTSINDDAFGQTGAGGVSYNGSMEDAYALTIGMQGNTTIAKMYARSTDDATTDPNPAASGRCDGWVMYYCA